MLDVACVSTPAPLAPALNLVWWLKGQEWQNFGDFLSEFLWRHLAEDMRVEADVYRLIGSGISEWIVRDDLNAIGKWENGRVAHWCGGMRDEQPLSPEVLARSVFCGVRGPLTRDCLGLPPSTPIGDPAFLLPLVHSPARSARTSGRVVLSPHFLDTRADDVLLQSSGAQVVIRPRIANTMEAVADLISDLASADFVLASSLHAAIVACAYDVPFCYYDSGHVDVPFKWRDFSASIGVGTFFVDNAVEGRRIYDSFVRPRLKKPLLFPILAAAPFRPGARHLLKAALLDSERLREADSVDQAAFSAFIEIARESVAVGSASRNETTRLRVKLREALASLDAVKVSVAESRSLSERLERERDEALAALLGVRSHLDVARCERDDALAELAELRNQLADVARERDTLLTSLSEASTRAAERKRELDDALSRLARVERARDAAQAAADDALARALASERERLAAGAALKEAVARAAESQRQRDDAAASFREANLRAADRERERDDALSRLATAEQRRSTIEAQQDQAFSIWGTELTSSRQDREFLARYLARTYQRPWRPLKHWTLYLSLAALEILASPLSPRAAGRFGRSAHKRRPWRFKAYFATSPSNAFLPDMSAISETADLKQGSIAVLEPSSIREARPTSEPSAGEAGSGPRGKDLCAAFLTWHGDTAIFFPPVEKPVVSIVIPAYRNLPLLETCLRSIAAFRSTEPSFEVIVVDDSPDAPVNWALPNSGGLIKVDNTENLGFLRTCNRGAREARGDYLCFLNSDTIVSAGWLRSLIEALDESPEAAVAGCMLLNVDGTIQDAGWRILANGWGHPLGRNADSRDGAYTYRRSIDCVTGACFVTPTKVFAELGGLDTHFAPAFYEEFDYCFRARREGYRTIYEPRSRVVHLGSASYGPDQRDRLSSRNHEKFVQRFASTLSRQPMGDEDDFVMRDDGAGKPAMLIIDYSIPQPDRHAGDVTMMQFIALLLEQGWRLAFLPWNGEASGPLAERLERKGVEIIRPPVTLAHWLETCGGHLREAFLARPEIASEAIPLIRSLTRARIAYYTHDLHYLRMLRGAELSGSLESFAEAERMKQREIEVFSRVDVVTTPSRDEAQIIAAHAPAATVCVVPPYSYDDDSISARVAEDFAASQDILFVGGFPHLPNVDAAVFIVRGIMPLVWDTAPQAKLILAGYGPPQSVRDLAGERVLVTGQVPSLAPYYARARVVLAALRYGSGVKGKVVEALRVGAPVVTTSIGAEGIGLTPGQDAIIAESAAELAAGVLALLKDPARCASLSAAGARLVRSRFSREAARQALRRVFPEPSDVASRATSPD